MAIEIPLSSDQVALVDDADVAFLARWKWSASRCHRNKFVAMRTQRVDGRSKTIYMARELLGLKHGDIRQADHLNHDTLDNRRSNLRIVTSIENKRRQPSRGGTSAYLGVTQVASTGRWRAQIMVDQKGHNLGDYDTELEAALVRDNYVLTNRTGHGLNFA